MIETFARRRANRRMYVLWACLGLTALLLSCTTPAGVSEFAQNAQQVLVQSPPIFRDLHDSCMRRHADAALITPRFMPADGSPPGENPVCAPLASQGEGLIQAANVLGAYFRAMQQLASFNASAVTSTSEQAGENAGTAAKFSSIQADSVGKLAAIVTELLTERYQHTKLIEFLRQADPAIASVTQALEDVVAKDYEGFLHEEQQSLAAQYQNVGDTGNPAILLLLNHSYIEDLHQLNQRKAAADTYVKAMQQIREGHHQLAVNASRLKAKELSMALQPFTTRLQGLIPGLEKGF